VHYSHDQHRSTRSQPTGTHRSRRLAPVRLDPEDLVRKVSQHTIQAQPVNVRLRVRRRGYITSLGADDERVGVPGLACGREVPLRGQTRARERVRDEVVLAEHERGLELREGGDELRSGDGGRRGAPSIEGKCGKIVERRGREARDVENIGQGSRRPIRKTTVSTPLSREQRINVRVRPSARARVVLDADGNADELGAAGNGRRKRRGTGVRGGRYDELVI
jgi:hypothetical protein